MQRIGDLRVGFKFALLEESNPLPRTAVERADKEIDGALTSVDVVAAGANTEGFSEGEVPPPPAVSKSSGLISARSKAAHGVARLQQFSFENADVIQRDARVMEVALNLKAPISVFDDSEKAAVVTVSQVTYRRMLHIIQSQRIGIERLQCTLNERDKQLVDEKNDHKDALRKLHSRLLDHREMLVSGGGGGYYPRSLLVAPEFATEAFLRPDSHLGIRGSSSAASPKRRSSQWQDSVTCRQLRTIFVEFAIHYVSSSVPSLWLDGYMNQRDSRFLRLENIVASYFAVISSSMTVAQRRLRQFLSSVEFWSHYHWNHGTPDVLGQSRHHSAEDPETGSGEPGQI